jgi:hypothetical protein
MRHTFWHDVWTNAVHDDRDLSIARMLVWQKIKQNADAVLPFQGENLHALLTMGLLPFVFQSIPFQGVSDSKLAKHWLDHYNPLAEPENQAADSSIHLSAVREYMVRIAHSILCELPPSAQDEFLQFWADVRKTFLSEYERHCEFNERLVS